MLRHVRLCAVATARNPPVGAIGAPLAAAPNREGHPITGAWLVVTLLGPAELVFDAQRVVLVVWPHSGEGPNGYYEYTTTATGAWYPVHADTLLMSVVAGDADAEGTVVGPVAIMSRSVVSSDGGSCRGSAARTISPGRCSTGRPRCCWVPMRRWSHCPASACGRRQPAEARTLLREAEQRRHAADVIEQGGRLAARDLTGFP